jgi:hypothetical protein
MPNFNIDDYIPVNERLLEFYKRFPEGSIQAEILELDESHVVMKASAYREPHDPRPGVGHAHEINDGKHMVNKTSMIENCETSSWGRALAGLGLEVSKAIASREEMKNAKRREENLDKTATKVDPEKEEGYEKKMELFKSIKALHALIGAKDDAAKKELLKESGISSSFTKMGLEQLQQYESFLAAKVEGAPADADE